MSLEFKKRPSKRAIIATGITTFLVIAGISSSVQNNSDQPSDHINPSAQTEQVKGAQTQKAPVVETKTLTQTEAIPYSKNTENDSSLESGKTLLTTTGVDGQKTITYSITLTDGHETSRTKTGEQITRMPIDEVTKIGTKVAAPAPTADLSCPNGTYVNSVGNTVCSPYASSSIPAGATAQCRDGSYSFSQSRSGTCSHHGGVSVWY